MSSIHILDDDSLLNVFFLYRLTHLEVDNNQIFGGRWVRERWWYKPAHVCQRWRSLILGAASYLDLCLVCTYLTPIADMLAHSPPLPLVIDCLGGYYQESANCDDEAGILIALQQRDQVRRIRLSLSASYPERLIVAIDGEFPMLDYLYLKLIGNSDQDTNNWTPPTTFQAPRLRHLILSDVALPIRSPLLTTEAGLVTLILQSIHPSSYVSPNELLQQLSLMHHLQSFVIHNFPVLEDHVNERLSMITPVTLPNLRSFAFQGEGAYLEALLPHITTPLLEKLYIRFYGHPMRSISYLLQFIMAMVNCTGWPSIAILRFEPSVASVELYPDVGAQMYSISLCSWNSKLNGQVTFAADVLDDLKMVLSEVVHFTLDYRSSEVMCTEWTRWDDQPDRTDWRKLLGAFGNVKTLSMHNRLFEEVSRSLRWEDGESPVNLLPELDKLECHGGCNASEKFAPFIDARRDAGRPVTLVPFEELLFPNNEIFPSIPSPFEPYFGY